MRAKEFIVETAMMDLSPQTIHKLADHKGVKWDDEPSFLQLTKRLTGKEHLDDLDQTGLNKVKKHLDGLQGVTESLDDDAEEYRAHLIKTLPQIMKLFANIGKGWIPSKEQMLSAVDTAYRVMKHTGDAKQAGKVLMDELNALYRMSKGKQDVAEGKVINTYLWHGSRQKIPMLEPRQSVDTGGAVGSNQNAIYATSDPKVAIAMGLTTAGSDTGMFPNDPQMILFSGKIRKGEYVYLHKLPFNGPDGKPQFVQGGNSREFHSIPGVEGIKPIEIKEIPVNKYLNLIRKATPADLKLRKKYMKKQGVGGR